MDARVMTGTQAKTDPQLTTGKCIVAVDVGNTAVKLAVSQDTHFADHSIAIRTNDWQTLAIDWVRQRLGCEQVQWRIGSVQRPAADSLIAAIEADSSHNADDRDEIWLIRHTDVPLTAEVETPDRLGIDRLLSAFAATQCEKTNVSVGGLVVIDAGSAITVDQIDSAGVFRGGAIMPGLQMQADSLASGTDALPRIEWSDIKSTELPGTNTQRAIQGGILVGVAAAIDRLALMYLAGSEELQDHQIVLTGGDAETISPHLQSRHLHRCNLVCRGLLDLTSKIPASIAASHL